MIHQFYTWAKGGWKYNWGKYAHHYVNSSSIPNTQEIEKKKHKFNNKRRMHKDVAHIYNGIYMILTNRIWRKMDEY